MGRATGVQAESGALTKNKIIAELTRSSHGKLEEYARVGREAALREPEFLAHLIAWNQQKGQIRDSKVALPVIQLAGEAHPTFRENALAHLALQSPRELVKAVRFAKQVKTPQHGRQIRKLVGQYLRAREQNWAWWERSALQHRASLRELYALFHIKPNGMADAILFKGQAPKGTIFSVIRELKDMPTMEAAGMVMEHRIPFLVLQGALGKRLKEPDLVLALIGAMSPAELVTNTKMLERLGVKELPALRAAFEEGLKRAAESGKGSTLKTTRAAEALGEGKLAEKLRGLQEKQLDKISVEGDWLVLADKSGSMEAAIEAARQVAGVLARMVKGEVHLVFFDTSPRALRVTGMAYDEIRHRTDHVTADGGTSIGCGLQWAIEKGLDVDGIAVVSDGDENSTPRFPIVYTKACELWGKNPPVYFYKISQDPKTSYELGMEMAGHDLQVFGLGHGQIDYYSLPNLVQTMRTQRYSLADEIMESELLTVEGVLRGRGLGA